MIQVYVFRDKERLGYFDVDFYVRFSDERKFYLVLVVVQEQYGYFVSDIVQGFYEYVVGGGDGDGGCKKLIIKLLGFIYV